MYNGSVLREKLQILAAKHVANRMCAVRLRHSKGGLNVIMQETFGQRFQRLRKSAGLTQEDVANRLNITAQAVSKWENDISAPDISVLAELSDILNVSLDELLGKTPSITVVPVEQRKNIDSMFLRMKVNSHNGDKVNINLPIAAVRLFLDSGIPLEMKGKNGENILAGLDLKQLFSLIEQGVIGKIMDVRSADGDIVEIWVE